jgi:hypothetical protein
MHDVTGLAARLQPREWLGPVGLPVQCPLSIQWGSFPLGLNSGLARVNATENRGLPQS